MIRFYSLNAIWDNEWPSYQRDVVIEIPDLHVPRRYCYECKVTPSTSCTDIPETPSASLLEILAPYQQELPDQLVEAIGVAVFDGDYELSGKLQDELDRFNAVQPEEYDKIVQQIRLSMNLDQKRLILPGEHIGPMRALVHGEPKLDFICDTYAVMTEKAAELLACAGLKGCEVHRIQTLGAAKLYTMVVYGDGGIPITEQGSEWRQCTSCGEWWLWSDVNQYYRQQIDPQQWDGSDFFHLAAKGRVYVSENAKQWLEHSGLRADLQFSEYCRLFPTQPKRDALERMAGLTVEPPPLN